MPKKAALKQQGARKQTVKAVGLLFCLAFLFALLCGSGATRTSGGLPARQLDFAGAQLDGAELMEDGRIWVYSSSASITFYHLEDATNTLGVHTSAPEDKQNVSVEATLFSLQTNPYGYEVFIQADQLQISAAGRYNSAVLRMRSNEAPLGNIRLVLSSIEGGYYVDTLVLNESGFSFNVGQFVLLFLAGLAVWCVWQTKVYRTVFNPQKRRHRQVLWGVAGALCLLLVWLMATVNGPEPELLWEYNPNDLESLNYPNHYSHYYHLFDALKHGQLSLRTLPPAELATLTNPYDPVAREGIYYMWDVAYYGGQYYVYFGLAPMPLYFLTFWFTGKLPSPALATFVPAVLAVAALVAALLELLRHYNIKPNLLLTALAVPAAASGSLLLLLMASADTYVQPYLWGFAGAWGFVAALYRAQRAKHPAGRLGLFALAGFCVVSVAAARPTMLLVCIAFAVPLLLHLLRQKNRKLLFKLLDIAALTVPVAAGAVLLMAYNVARFGNPFDFGNTYQLTVGDMRTQTLRFSPVWLLQALFFYLLQPLLIQPRFPYVWMGGTNQYYYGSYFYNYPVAGLVNFPMYWPLLGMGKTLRGQSAHKRGTYIGVCVAGAVALWAAYCISNLHYRYPADAAVGLVLVAMLVLLELASCRAPGQMKGRYILAGTALVVSFVVGWMLCFTNERDFIRQYSTDTYLFFARLLNVG